MKKNTIRDQPTPAAPAPLVLPCPFPPAWGDDRHGLWIAFTYQGVRQVLRWIAPGSFLMGSPASEAERDDDERQHPVTLTQGYWLADTACTQSLWRAVTGDNPSGFKGEDRPVESVSWNDAQDFITKLNQAVPGLNVCLPTEAEWEYACRAGTQTPFWFGTNITPEQVNYNGNFPYVGGKKGLYREQTVGVKELPCNAWGLYQMHGNVWEWCQDWFGPYPTGPVSDPLGSDSGGYRVLRGGSWLNGGRHVRAAYRNRLTPDLRTVSIGFRLARGQ
jgi:formylglycine-generating enzyme